MITGLGIGIPHQKGEEDSNWYHHVASTLPMGWWYNWTYPDVNFEINRVRMCWYTRTGSYYKNAVIEANKHPEQFWLVQNEPEHLGQANTKPELAAQEIQKWVSETKNEWAYGGNLFASPGAGFGYDYTTALEWLNRYLDAGGAIPDAWHFHTFLWETSPEKDLRVQLEQQSEWMVQRGVVRPVIISEVAWLYDNPSKQYSLMRELYRLLLSKQIQAVAWYSSGFYPVIEWSQLLDNNGNVTLVGKKWLQLWEVIGQSSNDSIYLPIVST